MAPADGSTEALRWSFRVSDSDHELRLVPVPGTAGTPFQFGHGPNQRPVEVRDFRISSTPVTQALWTRVMGSNPAVRPDVSCPVENVSWNDVTGPDGFLDRLNAPEYLETIAGQGTALHFRLPSETEWEYAARGGPHWRDGFAFSGSNDPDEVAWYGRRFSAPRRLLVRLLGWRIGWRIAGRGNHWRPSRTHDVATKAPNQLGIHDMSGNVWEWCQDTCVDDVDKVPRDGSPYPGAGDEKRLRGGCHHNWDLHCTVWWRYGIAREAHDGCIGFRVVLA